MPIIFANVIQDAFSPLIKVFEAVMVFFHDNLVGGSWGLAIIALTVVVRAALLPLTLKQFQSMSKLQALAPQMAAIKERYKEDKQRQQEETMKLYRENKVNPFGSCLPLVLQFPVFISLFYMLRIDLKTHICGAQLHAHHILTNAAVQKTSCGSVKPGSGKFLFIHDITTKATGTVLIVLIVLYIGSQLFSSLLMTVTTDKNQRLIAIGIPFVFTFVIIGFPAGLLVYWITSNLWTIVQQYIVKKRVGVPGAPAAGGTKDKDSTLPQKATATPAVVGAAGLGRTTSRPSSSPPPSARKKKKRSGRRR
ncbi:MAG: YidC/Oxa1 family membrane protein insertase [Solirubrobacteraceae bacterium]